MQPEETGIEEEEEKFSVPIEDEKEKFTVPIDQVRACYNRKKKIE